MSEIKEVKKSSNTVKVVNSLLLLVVGFFGSIYITAPTIIKIYNLLIFPFLPIHLSIKPILGVILIFSLVSIKFRNKPLTIEEAWARVISFYVFVYLSLLIAHAYVLYLA